MHDAKLSVRELQEKDIESITDYWLDSDPDYLMGLGVDLDKMPSRDEWTQMLTEQLKTPINDKKSYCIIWLVDQTPVGHSNINKIIFGQEAYMHIHLWGIDSRKKGLGPRLIKMTLPWFFENFRLKKLYCEPFALNPAPNKTLEKIGFNLVKEFVTTPGWLNFEQPVKLWELNAEDFEKMK